MGLIDWVAAGLLLSALVGTGYLACVWALSEFGGDA